MTFDEQNKSHWRRDTSLWKEGARRPLKKSNGAKNLALLRGAVLRLLPLQELPSLSGAFDANFAHRWPALKLLKLAPPQTNQPANRPERGSDTLKNWLEQAFSFPKLRGE